MLLFVVGILLEDVMSSLLRHVPLTRNNVFHRIKKVVGFLWVFCWFAFSPALYLDEISYALLDQGYIGPYDFVATLGVSICTSLVMMGGIILMIFFRAVV